MAFNPELGSTSPAVLLDNAERLDKLVNGSALTEPDRAGDDLDTWRGMMAKNDEVRQNLIPLSKQYATLAAAQADIANIPVGATTYYRSPDDSALAIEVMNVAGTLTPTGRKMPSQETVEIATEQAVSANDATARLITALESLALKFAGTEGDVADIQKIILANVDGLSSVITACEALSLRQANIPDELAALQLSFGFSLDIVLDALFKLRKVRTSS